MKTSEEFQEFINSIFIPGRDRYLELYNTNILAIDELL